MADLAHWNFSDHFTAKEAASLIVGVDPGADDQNKRVPVLRRITQAYGKAENDLNAAATFGNGLKYWLETCPFDDDALLSEQMLLVVASENHYGLECYADNFPNFNFAMFTRTEICRWLKAIGLKSAYQFDRSAAAIVTYDIREYAVSPAPGKVEVLAPQTKASDAGEEQGQARSDPAQTQVKDKSSEPNWILTKPPHWKCYNEAVYTFLKSAIDSNVPNRPSASDLIKEWNTNPAFPITKVDRGIVFYTDSKGDDRKISTDARLTKDAIARTIARMTKN